MRYVLGLDVGITSVGWSVINIDRYKIEDLGVRIFTKAENPKNGKSLASPRRLARGQRRTIKRKSARMSAVRRLIDRHHILSLSDIEKIYNGKKHLEDIWEVRSKALDKQLSNEELVRVLIHIAKRRGFKSNRRIQASSEKEKEERGLKGAINENKDLMIERDYRTVGEMICKDPKFNNQIDEVHKSRRNKASSFNSSISRDMLIDEIRIIFQKQRNFGNDIATEQLEAEYLDILVFQRPFATKETLQKLVGKCTFERKSGLKRAPKASYTFNYFNILQKLNAQRIRTENELRHFTNEEKQLILDYVLTNFEIEFNTVRKLLKLTENIRFVGVNYKNDDLSSEKKTKMLQMKYVKDIHDAISQSDLDFNELSPELLDKIGYELTFCKNNDELEKELLKLNISREIISSISNLTYSGVCNLSYEAMNKIIPYLEEGLMYHEACEKAGYDFRALGQGQKQFLLPVPEADDLTNPVVRRAISQSRKVINSIIRKYGSPYRIHIEMARELAKNFEERGKISKLQDENRKNNERVIAILKEVFNINPTGQEIIKYRLFEEQDGLCLYSRKPIDRNLLFGDPTYTEIDHIIPYSRSFDDSFANKGLVLASENRKKGNRTPYEYIPESDWDVYEAIINNMCPKLSKSKKRKILKKSFTREDSLNFKNRSLQDTQYATTYLANFIRENLIFEIDDSTRIKVLTINGRMTAYLRKRWGLSKNRNSGDKHHALDATIIAATSFDMINEVSRISKLDELKYIENTDEFIDPETGEILDETMFEGYNRHLHKFKLPEPWEGFRLELEARVSNTPKENIEYLKPFTYTASEINELKPIFVSRAPNRGITGAAHKDTIRSSKKFDEGKSISKVALENIPFDKNGDFPMYGKESDVKVYNAIKDRYLSSGKKAKVAFIKPLYKLKSDGTPNAIIKKVKILDKMTSGVMVNNGDGVANNGEIIRVDVFKKDGKYYLIPIYASDFAKKELPNRYVTLNKNQIDWESIDDTYEFEFSLYKDDLVKVTKKNGVKIDAVQGKLILPEVIGYFSGLDIHTMGITIKAHDTSWLARGIGTRILEGFEKLHVDVLGNVTTVKKEKRLGLSNSGC